VQDQADTSSLHPLVYCFCLADTPWLTRFLHRGHHRLGSDLHLPGLFDDFFKRRTNVPLALGEEVEGVRVTVNCGPIRKAKFLGNGLDTGPVDEFPLDLLPVLMGTDLAVAPVATMSLLPCCPYRLVST